MQRKWRLAAAAAALLTLLGAAVIAGLAAALPDTLYTDEPAAELRIASLPYLSARKNQGAVPADSTAPDTSSNVTLALFGVLGFHGTAAQVVTRLECCPAAAITSVFAVQFGHDEHFAAGSVVLTTLLSIITLPLSALIITMVM